MNAGKWKVLLTQVKQKIVSNWFGIRISDTIWTFIGAYPRTFLAFTRQKSKLSFWNYSRMWISWWHVWQTTLQQRPTLCFRMQWYQDSPSPFPILDFRPLLFQLSFVTMPVVCAMREWLLKWPEIWFASDICSDVCFYIDLISDNQYTGTTIKCLDRWSLSKNMINSYYQVAIRCNKDKVALSIK